jgi:hypothetical protein
VRTCIHMGECSYVYEYLRLYCVYKKTKDTSHNSSLLVRKGNDGFAFRSFSLCLFCLGFDKKRKFVLLHPTRLRAYIFQFII